MSWVKISDLNLQYDLYCSIDNNYLFNNKIIFLNKTITSLMKQLLIDLFQNE